MATMLKCRKCQSEKDLSHFRRTSCGRYWDRICRSCRSVQSRNWRKNHFEQSRALARKHAKKYASANPEKIKSQWQAYYAKNADRLRNRRKEKYWQQPERERLNARRWAEEHREHHRAKARIWYQNNKFKKRATKSAWAQANPERIKLYKRQDYGRRKAAKHGTTSEKFSLLDILKRDGQKCHICEKSVARKDISFDHLIPLSRGGGHSRNNVAVAHLRCNLQRGPGRIPAQLRLIG